uniref:Uncharacterized protein n=1 Tax=Romanomermis culicivorax TaxID=13658 RepID=A0A915IIY4_ROMCU
MKAKEKVMAPLKPPKRQVLPFWPLYRRGGSATLRPESSLFWPSSWRPCVGKILEKPSSFRKYVQI